MGGERSNEVSGRDAFWIRITDAQMNSLDAAARPVVGFLLRRLNLLVRESRGERGQPAGCCIEQA